MKWNQGECSPKLQSQEHKNGIKCTLSNQVFQEKEKEREREMFYFKEIVFTFLWNYFVFWNSNEELYLLSRGHHPHTFLLSFSTSKPWQFPTNIPDSNRPTGRHTACYHCPTHRKVRQGISHISKHLQSNPSPLVTADTSEHRALPSEGYW